MCMMTHMMRWGQKLSFNALPINWNDYSIIRCLLFLLLLINSISSRSTQWMLCDYILLSYERSNRCGHQVPIFFPKSLGQWPSKVKLEMRNLRWIILRHLFIFSLHGDMSKWDLMVKERPKVLGAYWHINPKDTMVVIKMNGLLPLKVSRSAMYMIKKAKMSMMFAEASVDIFSTGFNLIHQ